VPATDEKMIKQGLRFLARADAVAIRAAAALLKLQGAASVPTAAGLLKPYTFDVGKGEYRFSGRMTRQQADYLSTQTASLLKFGHALQKILVNSNHKVNRAVADLDAALGSGKPRMADGLLSSLRLGCCVYDETMEENVSKTYCINGLQGDWTDGPC
jgi:hypothetical protein